MKNLTKMMAVGLLTAGLAACSNEDELPVKGDQSLTGNEKVYMSLNLSFPKNQSRSATVNTQSEVGLADENKVGSIQLLLVDQDGNQAVGHATPTGNKTAYTAVFPSAELVALAGKTVNVYAACNKTDGDFVITPQKYDLAKGLVSASYPDIKGIWTSGKFLMANASATSTILPSADVMKTKHTTEADPVELGTVNVERAAVRFDYKTVTSDNKYAVGDKKIDVVMEDVALLNVSKDQFMFRQVSEAGDWNAPLSQLLQKETTTNYVVDYDWAWKATNTYADVDQHMLNPIGTFDADKTTAVGFKDLASLTTDDNYVGEYKVVGYASENTIGKLEAAEDAKKGQVTVAVFKGKLVADEGLTNTALRDKINAVDAADAQVHEALYAYNNVVYGTWADVKAKIADPEAPVDLVSAYDAVVAAGYDPLASTEPTAKQATDAKFTIYTWHDGGYAVYYYYYNLHNDTGKSATDLISPMRYGTVRNNVYKLSISKIMNYGHPFDQKNDPEPIDPTDPIISSKVYFKVDVSILPWTVRVNDIEF